MKFCELIEGKQEYRLSFIGGSITYGSGSSDITEGKTKRYSSLFTKMIGNAHKDVKFTEINSSVGGTPSSFGLFRLRSEILDLNPDFLFIEYAVNDTGDYLTMPKYFEAIIRTARRWNPKLPICVLFAYSKELVSYFEGKDSHYPIEIQSKIAKAYGIPTINMGYDMWQRMIDYGGDFLNFTIDNVHPNDAGYACYVDTMMREIHKADFGFDFPQEPITGREFTNPGIYACQDHPIPEGWLLSTKTLWENPLKYIHTDTPGVTYEMSFEGTAFALMTRMEKDGGMVEVWIDGKFIKKTPFWDRHSLFFDRNAFDLVTDKLEYGRHDVLIKVLDEKPSSPEGHSEGHVIRIAAMLYA